MNIQNTLCFYQYQQSLFNLRNESNFNQNNIEKSQKKKITRNKFRPEEDNELIKLVSIYSDNNWKKISEEMSRKNNLNSKDNSNNNNRTPRQCKDRYLNYLSPNINNRDWTVEEDQLLLLKTTLSYTHWKEMKQLFPGRSEIAIRNRFNYLHRIYMNYLKPNIANSISSITISQKSSTVEIEDPTRTEQNTHDLNSEEYLKNINLNFDQSNVLEIFNNNCSKIQILPIQQNNSTQQPPIVNNQQVSNVINKKKKMENIMVPQQWIDAAKIIIEATKTDEAKNLIQELKKKVESLNGILKNRAMFTAQNNLFNIPSEFEMFDDQLNFEMFE